MIDDTFRFVCHGLLLHILFIIHRIVLLLISPLIPSPHVWSYSLYFSSSPTVYDTRLSKHLDDDTLDEHTNIRITNTLYTGM